MANDGQTKAIFVQLRCKPGTTYDVAFEIYQREIVSQLFSTSGEWDLIAQIYPPADVDVGKWINENLNDIVGIERSLTTLTFKAF
ncbi:Lrp/AsnC family transcriptional regulator [Alphaproteobacteria bacterium KMM 3653]|uniref:Lrp/AsnC family transcriptional regulator n=1 Tax=Harenicola maris TaxID=2841044 RepID=A0AAP2CP32_9RHOB|nr:Lrp/AsnC family transcriptional regulator [Harenicola maris]